MFFVVYHLHQASILDAIASFYFLISILFKMYTPMQLFRDVAIRIARVCLFTDKRNL